MIVKQNKYTIFLRITKAFVL